MTIDQFTFNPPIPIPYKRFRPQQIEMEYPPGSGQVITGWAVKDEQLTLYLEGTELDLVSAHSSRRLIDRLKALSETPEEAYIRHIPHPEPATFQLLDPTEPLVYLRVIDRRGETMNYHIRTQECERLVMGDGLHFETLDRVIVHIALDHVYTYSLASF